MNNTPLPRPAPPINPSQPVQPPQVPQAEKAPTSMMQQTAPVVPTPQSPTPPGPPTPAAPAQRPPTALSALSSMSSTKLPPQPPTGSPSPAPSSAQAPSAAGKGPVFANSKKTPFKLIAIIGGVILLVLVAIFAAMRIFGNRSADTTNSETPNNGATNTGESRQVVGNQVSLEYWGLWEPNEVLAEVLKEFEQKNPGVTVRYTKQSHKDYRERLQTAIASGNGPDVYRFHASWTPMLTQELAPAPSSVISASDFQKTYYPAAVDQLQVNGQVVGIPLMYDGLALYYNKDIFRTANLQPPKTWPELKTMASQLTVTTNGSIERGGIALGNATNVEHFADVIALLMLQNGADLKNPNTQEGKDALMFYTNFIRTDKVWNDTLPSSTVAFARGDAAMMLAPSWRAHEIKAINPQLNFGVTTLPKLQNTDVTWASFWAEGVNSKSKKTEAAWKLISFLSTPDTLKKLYSNASEVRGFGELYPRMDMAPELANNEYIAPYLSDAKQAKGGFMSSYTHDNGLNDLIIKYYKDGVTALVTGKNIDEVMVTIDQGTKQTMRQYGVKTTN